MKKKKKRVTWTLRIFLDDLFNLIQEILALVGLIAILYYLFKR